MRVEADRFGGKWAETKESGQNMQVVTWVPDSESPGDSTAVGATPPCHSFAWNEAPLSSGALMGSFLGKLSGRVVSLAEPQSRKSL